jgi:hypothetical protein
MTKQQRQLQSLLIRLLLAKDLDDVNQLLKDYGELGLFFRKITTTD